MTSVKKVLIVGGGIGGLCAAIGLRDKGIAVDMVEIKEEWTVYGVGSSSSATWCGRWRNWGCWIATSAQAFRLSR